MGKSGYELENGEIIPSCCIGCCDYSSTNNINTGCSCGADYDVHHGKRHASKCVYAEVKDMREEQYQCKRPVKLNRPKLCIMDECERCEEYEEDWIFHNLIEWNKIKEGDIISYNSVKFVIAFKTMRNHTRILYLRPKYCGRNEVVEIERIGLITRKKWSLWNNPTYNVIPPLTPAGYESWTEEHLDSLKKVRSLLR